MKSLHLTNSYHPASGGIRTWYRQVLAAADREGWEARLVVPAERSSVEDVDRHVRIHHVAAPRAPAFDRRYRLILPHRYLFSRGAVQRILLHEQPDVVEVADKYALNWLGGAIRKGLIPGLKRPLLVGFSFERMDDNVAAYVATGRWARRVARRYMKWCYFPLFDVHLAVSDYTAEELRAAAGPFERDRVHVQPCGLEASRFDPGQKSDTLRQALLDRARAGPETMLLLYVGRISPEKNIALLAEMGHDLAGRPGDYRLVVAGSGPLADWLQRQDFAHGRVVLWGQVQDRQALAELYATCDAFVHPNPREPFGIAPLEAMASGCPVVLPDSGGVRTYADESNAWLAAPTAAAFAGAVAALRANPALRQIRARRARQTALGFDSARLLRQLFARYAALLRTRGTVTPSSDDVAPVFRPASEDRTVSGDPVAGRTRRVPEQGGPHDLD